MWLTKVSFVSDASVLVEPYTTKEYQELIPNSFVAEPSLMASFGKRALVQVRLMQGLSCSTTFHLTILSTGSVYLRPQGLAFIATAEIEDEEELFLNYRCDHVRSLVFKMATTNVANKRALYVGGLDKQVTEQGLYTAFVPFGPLKSVQIPMDYKTQSSKGFGFVEFEDEADARAAIDNMDGACISKT
ncbi:hypothetical protein BBJ28_00006844 [Nothophytophthora sp. Chile5]|nr:hypothetical protein BBJ28_00006844 [Nothophytophthora sp. Chile5]